MRSRTHRRSQGRREAVEFGRYSGATVIYPDVSIGGHLVENNTGDGRSERGDIHGCGEVPAASARPDCSSLLVL